MSDKKTYKRPRLIIGGISSGCCKTTISIGLIGALRKKNINVQPYKIGPDYIDTAYLTHAAGKDAYNLDLWLMGRDNINYTFFKKSSNADISLMEGVMGLFDGGDCSTAEMARLLGVPVILCINCEKIGESVCAMIEGFLNFDKSINIEGLILAKVSGQKHYKLLKEAIEKRLKIKVLGNLVNDRNLSVKERYLGLTTVFEKKDLEVFIDNATKQAEKNFDIEKILEIAYNASDFNYKSSYRPFDTACLHDDYKLKIAYSFDSAFSFFYRQNIDILKMMGAECMPFSPLKDSCLDKDIDLLILWGGFPEVFAKRLSENKSLKNDILKLYKHGLPIYAECGGFIYLAKSFIDKKNKVYPMLGLIPADIKLSEKLKGFGYKLAQTRFDTIVGNAGMKVRGHEFHHSFSVEELPDKYKPYILRSKYEEGANGNLDGFANGNLFATYLHAHFIGNISLVSGLISRARVYRSKKISEMP
ncbi:MAG: cobyrinate a,c-diamide synthase [Actinomycetota bacterium]|nr:cobyrinate a,c-diamide synthase [Actinomycetota bacterium]